MLNITNGSSNLTVSKGAFETIFKPLGFTLKVTEVPNAEVLSTENTLSGEEGKEQETNPETQTEGTELKSEQEVPMETEGIAGEEVTDEELAEKPLSDMTESELIRFAGINEIDVAGIEGLGKLREKIHAELN